MTPSLTPLPCCLFQWHIYRKWNERLFKEMTLAFQNGHMAVNPMTFWYKGELGFFDNYVIPLAK
jgi:hypothetical protein